MNISPRKYKTFQDSPLRAGLLNEVGRPQLVRSNSQESLRSRKSPRALLRKGRTRRSSLTSLAEPRRRRQQFSRLDSSDSMEMNSETTNIAQSWQGHEESLDKYFETRSHSRHRRRLRLEKLSSNSMREGRRSIFNVDSAMTVLTAPTPRTTGTWHHAEEPKKKKRSGSLPRRKDASASTSTRKRRPKTHAVFAQLQIPSSTFGTRELDVTYVRERSIEVPVEKSFPKSSANQTSFNAKSSMPSPRSLASFDAKTSLPSPPSLANSEFSVLPKHISNSAA